MKSDLTVSDPEPIADGLLPCNFLTAAFANLATATDAPNRIVFQLSDDGMPRSGITYHVAAGKTLSSADELAAFLSARGFPDADTAQRGILGPPTHLHESKFDEPLRLGFDQPHLNADDYDQVAVIIDIGIAFWHDRFRVGNGSRFKAIRYLDFDAACRGGKPFSGLDEAEIAQFCTLSEDPNGPAQVVAELGRRFPDSFFAPDGGAVPDALWHGTATADLMAGLPRDTVNKTALFGIELPMAVLRDADGDSLTYVLALLVEAALEMTTLLKDKPLLILLPWGFSAGQQDGSHPAAQAIQQALAATPPRPVKMLVPTGNQLQDRCCARLAASNTPTPAQATWHLPPDDFSANTIEIFVTPSVSPALSGVQTMRIGAPDGTSFVIAIKESQKANIWRDGQLIGVLIRRRDGPTGPRLRLTFAGTGWRHAGQRPTPAGNWTLSFARTDDVSMWVLRDDRDRMLDGPLPRRTSWLADPAYKERDALGRYNLEDDPGSTVVRSGTISVLATAPLVVAVQADELMIGKPARQAFYSGRKTTGTPVAVAAIVDRDWQASGITVAINGSRQRARFTGTSAAVAIHARFELNLPPYPS